MRENERRGPDGVTLDNRPDVPSHAVVVDELQDQGYVKDRNRPARHWLPLVKHTSGPLLAAIVAITTALIHAKSGKEDSDTKAAAAAKTNEVKIDAVVAPKTDELVERVNALDARLKKLEKTVPAQGALIVANNPSARRRGQRKRVDPELVKKVVENAAVDLKDLNERTKDNVQPIKPLPAAVPQNPTVVPVSGGGAITP